MWLLANWKLLLSAFGAFGLSFMLHTLDVHRLEAKQAAEVLSVKQAMTAECDKAKAITNEVSHDYQIQLSTLDDRLSAAHGLLDNNACLSVTPSAATGHDAAATGQQHLGRSVDGNRIIATAGKAEKYRLQLISCQRFITLENAQEKLGE